MEAMSERDLEEFEKEVAAWRDFADRVARDDPDRGFYFPGDPRPKLPLWRRLLKIAPPS